MATRLDLDTAILALAGDATLLARFKADPVGIGREIGLTEEWSLAIAKGDRDRLRSAGVGDGITILVARWFRDDLADSGSKGKFYVDTTSPLPQPSVPRGLVFAGGCSHVPDLLTRPEIDPPDAVQRLVAAYGRLGSRLAEAALDVLILISDCHFQTFETAAVVVGVAAEHHGSMSFFKRPDIALSVGGDPDFARTIVAGVRARHLEVEAALRVDLDHGPIAPLRLLRAPPKIPVVPILTQPSRSFSPFGAAAFGRALREVIQGSGRRIGILATGGLSHWLDPGKFGFVDVEFDTYVLDMLKAGRGLDLSDLPPYPLLDHGQYELVNWLIMLGLIGPGVRGEVFAYEPMKGSGGGWAVVDMRLGNAAGTA